MWQLYAAGHTGSCLILERLELILRDWADKHDLNGDCLAALSWNRRSLEQEVIPTLNQQSLVWCTSLLLQPPPHHDRFTALFPGPPGWAGARRELLDFMVQGKFNRGRHTDHPAGRHSIRTNQCPPPPSSFLQARCPSYRPTNSVKALKVRAITITNHRHYQQEMTYCTVAVRVVYHPTVTKQLRSLGRAFGVLHGLDDSHQRNIAACRTAAQPDTTTTRYVQCKQNYTSP